MSDSQKKNLDGELFEKIVVNGANNLKANIKIVNDLNVFPIPDGDTGDNMFMTISGGLGGLKAVKENSLHKKAKALADGMLLNARGNSGVILSQLFAGLAKGFAHEEFANIKEFADALKEGVKQAYASVVQPVEGTMLTVAREAAEFAAKNSTNDNTIDEFFEIFVDEMQKSLERTPDLLTVLKEAGVIDSGGAGLLYIIEGMKNAIEGEFVDSDIAVTEDEKSVDFSKFNEDSVMTFGYCTECLLQLQTSKTDVNAFDVQTIIDYLNTLGDSIVAFKTGTIIKIHVHTLTPHKVLEFCQQYGEFLTIKIENMTLQHSEVKENKKPAHDFEIKMPAKQRAHKKFGVVTVATGKGLIDTFTEFGADVVIDGGQGNNPSIENFIEAFDTANCDVIFVLPNNGNIIMAAKQAAEMYDKAKINVIETKNFGQAYSILSMLDFSSDDEQEILQRMKNDMQGVITGMITPSIRSAVIDGVNIEKGNYIGFIDKKMLVSNVSKTGTFEDLMDKLCTEDKGFVIAVYGETITQEEKAKTAELVAEKYPHVEFYELDGGQDVYDYILIIE
ncbi:MAG: DAK2 domain-containing protein [Clostridia bacterium]|nr:DAK2 domain-containing protein [Clostridia bacterium]